MRTKAWEVGEFGKSAFKGHVGSPELKCQGRGTLTFLTERVKTKGLFVTYSQISDLIKKYKMLFKNDYSFLQGWIICFINLTYIKIHAWCLRRCSCLTAVMRYGRFLKCVVLGNRLYPCSVMRHHTNNSIWPSDSDQCQLAAQHASVLATTEGSQVQGETVISLVLEIFEVAQMWIYHFEGTNWKNSSFDISSTTSYLGAPCEPVERHHLLLKRCMFLSGWKWREKTKAVR